MRFTRPAHFEAIQATKNAHEVGRSRFESGAYSPGFFPQSHSVSDTDSENNPFEREYEPKEKTKGSLYRGAA